MIGSQQLNANLQKSVLGAAWCLCAAFPHYLQAAGGDAMAASSSKGPNAVAVSGAPQTEFTLSQLVSWILEHNPDIVSALRAVQGAEAGVLSASAFPNPRIEYGSGQNHARVASGVPGNVQSWSVVQPLENPWMRNARIDSAKANAQMVGSESQLTRNDVTAQILLRAYELLLREEELIAASESARLLEQVREKVRLRVEVGEAARYEAIKADAELISARQRETTARLMVEQSRLALNRLAAGKLPAQWKLVARLSDERPLPPLVELQARALEANPELRALQSGVQKAQSLLRSARASRLPGLELRYSELRDPEIRQTVGAVGLQIPLFDQRRGPVSEASAELARSQSRLDGRRAELQQQVLIAWQALEMANATVKALGQGALQEAESALRVAQAAYQFGERGILEVLDAQRVLRSVRADLLQAKFQAQVAKISLEQLAGSYANRFTGE